MKKEQEISFFSASHLLVLLEVILAIASMGWIFHSYMKEVRDDVNRFEQKFIQFEQKFVESDKRWFTLLEKIHQHDIEIDRIKRK